MKKTLYVLFALAIVCACAKEVDPVLPDNEKEEEKVVFTLSVGLPGDSDAKATLQPAEAGFRKTTWNAGDMICVNGVNSKPLAADAEGSVEFQFTQQVSAPYRVVYPAAMWAGNNAVNLPAVQGDALGEDKAKNVPLAGYAATADAPVALKHLCSYVKIQMTGGRQMLKEVEITSGGSEQLSGRFNFDFSAQDIALTPASSASDDRMVTVLATAELRGASVATRYCIAAIPAGTYAAGMNYRLICGQGGSSQDSYQYMDKKTTSDKTYKIANVTTMKTFEFQGTGFYYAVRSADDWNAMATAYNNGILTNDATLIVNIAADLDFTDKALVSLGNASTESTYFLGTLNGNGKTFMAAQLTRPIIAGIAETAQVNNVIINKFCTLTPGFDASDMTTKPRYTYSALVGYAQKGTISNCQSNATINLAGKTISNNTAIGGIAGELGDGAIIRNCIHGGAINVANNFSANPRLSIGGISGFTAPSSQIRSSRNEGNISVSGTSANLGIGGIVAYAQGRIVNCTTRNSSITANTTSGVEMGGIAGTVANANVFLEGSDFANTVSNEAIASTGATTTLRCGGLYGYISVNSTIPLHGTPFTNGSSISISNLRSDAGTKAYAGGIVGLAGFVNPSDASQAKDITFNIVKDCTVSGSITIDTGASLQANLGMGGALGFGSKSVTFNPTGTATFTNTGNILLKTASKTSLTTNSCTIGGVVGCGFIGAAITNCNVDSQYIGWPVASAGTSPDAKTVGPVYVGGLVGLCADPCSIGTSSRNCILNGVVAGTVVTSSNVTTLSSGCTRPTGTRYVITRDTPVHTGLKFSIIGDSISTYAGYVQGYTTYYPYNPGGESNTVDSVDKTYWMQLINKFQGSLAMNISFSGSCVSYAEDTYKCNNPAATTNFTFVAKSPSNDNKCFLRRYDEHRDLGNPDVIIIYGGTNDRNHCKGNVPRPTDQQWATVYGGFDPALPTESEIQTLCTTATGSLNTDYYVPAYIVLLKKIFADHPSAKVVCLSGDGMTDAQDAWVKAVCSYFAANGYNGRIKAVSFHNAGNTDGKPSHWDPNVPKQQSSVHPNAIGMTYIANFVYNELKNWL